MPKNGYKTITVSENVYDVFFKVYELNKHSLAARGINSFAAYISETMEQIRHDQHIKMRFIVLRANKHRVILHDTWVNKIIEVDPSRGKYGYCYHCVREDCLHAGFCVSLPQVYQK